MVVTGHWVVVIGRLIVVTHKTSEELGGARTVHVPHSTAMIVLSN